MVMTLHNDKRLQQNSINIEDGTGVSCVCGYICLETNKVIYLLLNYQSHTTTISPAVLLCNFSLTHCIFYTLSTSYCLKLNQAFRGNKTPTQSTVQKSHTVKPINLSTHNLKAKPNSHSAVLVTNCLAVTAGGTGVKWEKFAGSGNPS